MNKVHGTTALWLGSHRDENRASKEEAIEPVVHEGSCMLWDFRLYHRGTVNRGTEPRPLLYLTYCRPWFVEHLNFSKESKAEAAACQNKFRFGSLRTTPAPAGEGGGRLSRLRPSYISSKPRWRTAIRL